MKEIWIVEYCVDEDSPFVIKGVFSTRELAVKYVESQTEPDFLYFISQAFYYYDENIIFKEFNNGR